MALLKNKQFEQFSLGCGKTIADTFLLFSDVSYQMMNQLSEKMLIYRSSLVAAPLPDLITMQSTWRAPINLVKVITCHFLNIGTEYNKISHTYSCDSHVCRVSFVSHITRHHHWDKKRKVSMKTTKNCHSLILHLNQGLGLVKLYFKTTPAHIFHLQLILSSHSLDDTIRQWHV